MAEEKIETPEVAEPEAAAPEPQKAKKAKKKGKKGLVILIVILVVLVAAIAGMWIWHEKPSFCSAICHTPMDPYGDTYNAQPGEATTDKYGNAVANASGMMAVVHAAEGVTCLQCHVPTLSEQIGEGMEWISGNYTVVANDAYGAVLPETNIKDLVKARGVAEEDFCLVEGCHDYTLESLTEATSEYDINPHLGHHGKRDCSECHKAHRASLNVCTECHTGAPQPEGWITPREAKKLVVAK